MELRKRITVLVPSELVYAFDPDHEHIFIAAREKGRIVARPMEEVAMSGTRTRGRKVYNLGKQFQAENKGHGGDRQTERNEDGTFTASCQRSKQASGLLKNTMSVLVPCIVPTILQNP